MRIALIAVLMGILAVPARAQDEKIRELIEELGDESIDVREKAEAELKKLGKAALPETRRAAESHPDAEVRLRAAEIVRWNTEIRWQTDVKHALKLAGEQKKPLLVFSTVGPLTGYV